AQPVRAKTAMESAATARSEKAVLDMAREYSESAGSPSDSPAAGEFRTHSLVLPASAAGLRLDQALARELSQYSRARLQGWIEAGSVQVDGRRLRPKDKVLGGERVEIAARLEADPRVAAEAQPLALVHQDRALFVINKPAGMVVHPGAGNPGHTLQNALLALDPKLALVPRAGLVAALGKREVERTYLAICNGAMTGGGTVDAPIGRHRTQRTRMAVRSDGREAVTHYRIEKRYPAHTLVRVHLETGRTHQIRVHLAHAGYPIIGDPVYGGRRRLPAGCSPTLAAALSAFPRQALHAARLALAHPMTGRALEWEAPLADDMAQLLSALDHDQHDAE